MNSLSIEINQWVDSVSPSQRELAQRHEFYQQLFNFCSSNWRAPFVLELFGSWKTNLLLPGSDIDVVILDNATFNPQNAMAALTKRLQYSKIFRSVFFVRGAKVPIIKIQSKQSDLTADISCNVRDGVDGSNFINSNQQIYPNFRPVFLVLKRLLGIYELNDASNGGLGAYALSVMVLTYLRWVQDPRAPLGQQLLGVLEFYGGKFEVKDYAINFALLGGQVARAQIFNRHHVVVHNPLVPDHNVASACRKWYQVSKLFQTAFKELSAAVQMDLRVYTSGEKYFRKGDFAQPKLSVLMHLRTPSAPERIFNKVRDLVTKKSSDVNDEIVISDDEDYDSITHAEPKKRKRDDEEEELNNAEDTKTPKNSTSSLPSSPRTSSVPFPTFPPSSTNTNTNTTTPSSSSSTSSSSSSNPGFNFVAPSSPSSASASSLFSTSASTTSTTTTSTTTTKPASTPPQMQEKSEKPRKTVIEVPRITTSDAEQFETSLSKLCDAVRVSPTHCSLCKVFQISDFDSHLLSHDHARNAAEAGIFI